MANVTGSMIYLHFNIFAFISRRQLGCTVRCAGCCCLPFCGNICSDGTMHKGHLASEISMFLDHKAGLELLGESNFKLNLRL